MQILVIVGAIIYLFFNTRYVIDTVQGKVQPNRISWFLWSVPPFLAAFASLTYQISWSQVPVLMSGFMPFLIFIASFFTKKHYFELTRIDLICGLSSILALIVWAASRDPNITIALSIIADAAAGIPTILNAWKHPHTDSPAPFASGLVSTLTGLFTLQSFTYSEVAFPVYLIVLDTIMTLLTCRKYLKKK
ncbi:MAG: hypothetical protein LBI11_00950 [Streptococcaceae bacterium]|jgi:hypothetical protein|nr:hypothetical protein [Streptococcaceae bacterium]